MDSVPWRMLQESFDDPISGAMEEDPFFDPEMMMNMTNGTLGGGPTLEELAALTPEELAEVLKGDPQGELSIEEMAALYQGVGPVIMETTTTLPTTFNNPNSSGGDNVDSNLTETVDELNSIINEIEAEEQSAEVESVGQMGSLGLNGTTAMSVEDMLASLTNATTSPPSTYVEVDDDAEGDENAFGDGNVVEGAVEEEEVVADINATEVMELGEESVVDLNATNNAVNENVGQGDNTKEEDYGNDGGPGEVITMSPSSSTPSPTFGDDGSEEDGPPLISETSGTLLPTMSTDSNSNDDEYDKGGDKYLYPTPVPGEDGSGTTDDEYGVGAEEDQYDTGDGEGEDTEGDDNYVSEGTGDDDYGIGGDDADGDGIPDEYEIESSTPPPAPEEYGGYEFGGPSWVDPTGRPTDAYVPPPSDEDPLIEEEIEDHVLYHGLGGTAGKYLDSVESPQEMEKDKNVQVIVGILVPVFILLLLLTASLVMNHPDGLCAGCCRLTLKVISCFCRTLCLPCRAICGSGSDQAHGRRTHAPMRSPFPSDLELA